MSYHQSHLSRRSRRPWTGRASLIGLAGCLSCAVVWSTAAQDDCFRVVDIVELGFIPNPANFTFGLNDQHEAVGTYEVGGDKHAFLWLPVPAYNLTEGFHDLHTLADLASGDESAAYDINDAGEAVGWIKVSGNQVAVVWKIDVYDPVIPPLTYIDLSTYTVPDDGPPKIDVPTVAWAINDALPAVVVGDASGGSNCACPPTGDAFATVLGFTAVVGSGDLEELLPILTSPCDTESFGRDINSAATPRVVGYSNGAPIGPCSGDTSECSLTKDAVNYPSGAVPAALADLSAGGSEARGVNDGASIVGWGYANDDNPCQMSALFWATPMSSPFDLGSLLPVGQESRAEAITEPDGGGDMIVVGSNEDTQHALRWEGSGLTWAVVDLNDKIVGSCAGSDEIVVRQSHDVSNDGWIIAWADVDPGPLVEAHAVLLAPDQSCTVCCFADFDCSGSVGSADLLTLLASWGPCAGCPADLDCNGVVGANDLLLLLAAWGTCEMTAPTEIPRTVQDCFDKFYPNDLDALIACIEAIE